MSEVADNILEPRIKFAKNKATEIWHNLAGSKVHVVLNDIVQALGISVKEADLQIEGVSHMSSDGVCFIMYKRTSSVERQRITVAHELGHFVLEHIPLSGTSSQLSQKSQEQEAWAFARELLIPSLDLKNFLKTGNKTIDEIAKRYKVSRDVVFIIVNDNRLLKKIKTAT